MATAITECMARSLHSYDLLSRGLLLALGLGTTVACGGTVGGGTTSDAGGDAPPVDSPAPAAKCTSPVEIVVAGKATGYVTCAEGYVHRSSQVACPSHLPRTGVTCSMTGSGSACTKDSDCVAHPNGHCEGAIGGPFCACNYGCTTDAECGAGQICECGDPTGTCVLAACKADSDCGTGHFCSTYVVTPGCGGTAFACQTTADECLGDPDCSKSAQCSFADGHHACKPISCAIGRPFLVDEIERLGDVVSRGDWGGGLVTQSYEAFHAFESLGEAARATLTSHWCRVGQMEHASIAAFARFALQLLSLGAPPQLVERTQAAMADETHHTRLAFALASRYAGAGLGPGVLRTDDALLAGSEEQILRLTIREGCIGETVAAMEAAEALEGARDEAVRDVLKTVATDEAKHAELAWQFLKWRASIDPVGVAVVLREELSRAMTSAATGESSAESIARTDAANDGDGDALRAHGMLDEPTRQAIRRNVVTRVVAPCARELLASLADGAARESLSDIA